MRCLCRHVKQSIKWLIKWQVPKQICHETLVSLVEWCTFHSSCMPGGFQQAHKLTDSSFQRLLTVTLLIHNVKRVHLSSSHPRHFISFVSLFLLNGRNGRGFNALLKFFFRIQVCHQLLEICTLIGDLDTSILVNTWKALKR